MRKLDPNAIVTTPLKPSAVLEASAIGVSRRLGAEYIARNGASIVKLRDRLGGRSIIIVGMKGLEWHPANGGEPFFFHPGMSLVRSKRLAEGQRDAMLTACGFTPGDSVLDCTAGLGSDSIVFSFAGGTSTQVTALESELPLYFIVSAGLQEYVSDWPAFTDAMRRIQTKHTDHTAYLQALPDRSVDIVYFDPMFRTPVQASSGISPLRSLANANTLSEEAVAQARRVARKTVVLKERGSAEEWQRFGFSVVSKPGAPVAYGVIRI